MGDEREGPKIVMRCSECGRKYDPNPGGPAPITCDCKAPFTGDVVFGEFPDGSSYATELDVEVPGG